MIAIIIPQKTMPKTVAIIVPNIISLPNFN